MYEFDNLMRAERARTGNYGADCYDDESEALTPCDICGCTNYEFAVVDSCGNVEGCSNCREIRRY